MSNSWRIGVPWVVLLAAQMALGIELDVTNAGVSSLLHRAFYNPTRMRPSSCLD
jgi:hypothetical protein